MVMSHRAKHKGIAKQVFVFPTMSAARFVAGNFPKPPWRSDLESGNRLTVYYNRSVADFDRRMAVNARFALDHGGRYANGHDPKRLGSAVDLIIIAKLAEKGPFGGDQLLNAERWLSKFKRAHPDWYEDALRFTKSARDAGEVLAEYAWGDHKEGLRTRRDPLREVKEMRDMLSGAGYESPDSWARTLRAEGMGPTELAHRIRQRSLGRTHGILLKRRSERDASPKPFRVEFRKDGRWIDSGETFRTRFDASAFGYSRGGDKGGGYHSKYGYATQDKTWRIRGGSAWTGKPQHDASRVKGAKRREFLRLFRSTGHQFQAQGATVQPGTRVKVGDQIGTMRKNGFVHVAVRESRYGKFVDPAGIIPFDGGK